MASVASVPKRTVFGKRPNDAVPGTTSGDVENLHPDRRAAEKTSSPSGPVSHKALEATTADEAAPATKSARSEGAAPTAAKSPVTAAPAKPDKTPAVFLTGPDVGAELVRRLLVRYLQGACPPSADMVALQDLAPAQALQQAVREAHGAVSGADGDHRPAVLSHAIRFLAAAVPLSSSTHQSSSSGPSPSPTVLVDWSAVLAGRARQDPAARVFVPRPDVMAQIDSGALVALAEAGHTVLTSLLPPADSSNGAAAAQAAQGEEGDRAAVVVPQLVRDLQQLHECLCRRGAAGAQPFVEFRRHPAVVKGGSYVEWHTQCLRSLIAQLKVTAPCETAWTAAAAALAAGLRVAYKLGCEGIERVRALAPGEVSNDCLHMVQVANVALRAPCRCRRASCAPPAAAVQMSARTGGGVAGGRRSTRTDFWATPCLERRIGVVVEIVQCLLAIVDSSRSTAAGHVVESDFAALGSTLAEARLRGMTVVPAELPARLCDTRLWEWRAPLSP